MEFPPLPDAKGPADVPCGSCPYRKDAPVGLWHPEEYRKLPLYDLATGEQPPAAFFCHQQNGHLCAGWVGTHDTEELLALRLPFHGLSDAELDKTHEYVSPVPLFESGAAAALHGMSSNGEADRRASVMHHRLKTKLKDRIYE